MRLKMDSKRRPEWVPPYFWRAAKFWARVDRSGDCWIWQGGKNRNGYGVVRWERRAEGAHRVAWMLTQDRDIGDGHVCHHCDNPLCVRPGHLFLGTKQTNMWDKTHKGRSAVKLTADDVREIRRRLANGDRQVDIGKAFGVAHSAISNIKTGTTWSHVT